MINSFQSVISPYFENVYSQSWWSNQKLYSRIPEIYSKIVSNYTENTIALSNIFNDITFSNVNLFKNAVNEAKGHSKHLAEIGKRNIRVCEEIGKDNRGV
jgi:hypothetical protein